DRSVGYERAPELLGGLPPVSGRLLQQALYRRDESRRSVGPQCIDRGKLIVLLMIDDVVQSLAIPRPASGQYFPADEAQAVEIAARIDDGSVDLLRRHVGRSSDRDAGKCQLLRVVAYRARDAEVGQQRATGRVVDEDI